MVEAAEETDGNAGNTSTQIFLDYLVLHQLKTTLK